MTQSVDDRPDLLHGHVVCGFLCRSRSHRPLVRVDAPIGQQVQLRIEQLSIQLIARQAFPTAFTEDTQYRFGVLHFAYLLVLLVSDHLCPFALLSAFPSSLTGRCSWTTTGTVSL